jgi:hypothetical protein
MTATLLYRIAAVVFVLFAAGHTFGFLSFRPSSPEGLAVYEAMNSVQFAFAGAKYSYAKFYTGFGLTVTAYMLFSAFLAWDLGSRAAGQPKTIGALAWAFAAVQLACFVLSVMYFFLVPVLFSAAVVVCLVWAAWLVSRARA